MLCVSRVRHRAKLFCTHKCSVKCCTSERSTRNYNNSLSIYFSLSLFRSRATVRHTHAKLPTTLPNERGSFKTGDGEGCRFRASGRKGGGEKTLYTSDGDVYTRGARELDRRKHGACARPLTTCTQTRRRTHRACTEAGGGVGLRSTYIYAGKWTWRDRHWHM